MLKSSHEIQFFVTFFRGKKKTAQNSVEIQFCDINNVIRNLIL